MDVNTILNSTQAPPAQPPAAGPASVPAVNEKPAVPVDVYDPSKKPENEYKPDIKRLKELMAESEQKVESFRKMFESMVAKQADKFEAAFGASAYDITKNLGAKLDMLEVDEATRAQAQADIAEGGYWSVESTAARILDFAVALSGGDPSKIDALRAAVKQGYDSATAEWGRELPSISKQTFDAVMKGFDEWEESGSIAGITLLSK